MNIKIDSLQKKIFVFTLLAIFITLFSVELLFIYKSKYNVSESITENIIKKGKKTALDVEKMNIEAVTIAKVIADVQNCGLFLNYQESKNYLEQLLKSNDLIYGAYFIYDDDISSISKNKIKLKKDVFYIFNSLEGNEKIHSINVSEIDNNGYKIIKEKFYSNEPLKYFVSGLTESNGNNIIQFSTPIIINNKFAGICVIEVLVDKFNNMLAGLNKNADYMIFDMFGNIICSTIDNNETSKYYKLVTGSNEINNTKEELFEFQNNNNNEIIIKANIKTGGWFLLVKNEEDIINKPINGTVISLILIGLIGLLIAGVILYFISKKLVKPIWLAVDISNKILNDAEVKTTVHESNDEMGNLLNLITEMGKVVNTLFLKVRHSITEVKLNSDDIHITYQLQNKKVNEFSENTANISVSVEEITSKSQDLMQLTLFLLKSANNTSSSAENSYGLLQQLTTQMSNLSQLTNNNSQSLEKLSVLAGKISNVVTTMNKISDKTNLLALNASIEAEKAGDFGDGFALVGLEIKKLSAQINSSIYEIQEIITEIKQAVARALAETNMFLNNVNITKGSVNKTAVEVEEIIQKYKELVTQFNLIAEGMENQIADAKKLKNVIFLLNKNAEQSVEHLNEFYNCNTLLDNAVNNLRED